MDTVASRICHLRATLGLTQAQLGALAGVTKQAIVNWEKGRNTPTLRPLLALFRKRLINPLWILEGEEPMQHRSVQETCGEYFTASDPFSGLTERQRAAVLAVIAEYRAQNEEALKELGSK